MRVRRLIPRVAPSVALFMTLSMAQVAQAQTYNVVYSFQCGPGDGQSPEAGVIRDAAGNLYGTTVNGGSSFGGGIVFKVSAAGEETILHSFPGGATDGLYPSGRLVRDGAGHLYGTTTEGGTSNLGTVFEVSLGGAEKVLHSFAGTPDGGHPFAGLVRDAVGNLYGTTTGGGAYDFGTIFEVSADGVETVLYSFRGRQVARIPFPTWSWTGPATSMALLPMVAQSGAGRFF